MERKMRDASTPLLDDLAVPPEFTEFIKITTMTIATVGETGEPHAAAVYFASDKRLKLFFFSSPESAHTRDILADARAAVTIYPECRSWQDIRGLQLRGTVRQLAHGPDWERAWEIFAAKFPFIAELRPVVASNEFYVFEPFWLRLIDNRLGFGHKQEWRLEGGSLVPTARSSEGNQA
jgi:hypothetical protein